MTHYYCSTFSKGSAYKGLLLYNSLLRWDPDFHFFMICLHEEAKELFEKMNLKNATIIPLSAVEQEDRQLQEAKKTRNENEYARISKASVMLFILKQFQHTHHIVWLDADTCLYSHPEPLFDEWGGYSILLTKERWPKPDKHKNNTLGRYNTGFMGFKRDRDAIQCLKWFRSRLIEGCSAKNENNLWSGQIYVNDWRERFNNVGVIKNTGINVTPYMGYTATKDGPYVNVNGERLVFFHHYGFRYFDGSEFDLCSYKLSLSDEVLKWIYLPYIQSSNQVMAEIRKVDPDLYPAAGPRGQLIRNYFNLEVNEKADETLPKICTLLTKDYLLQGLALYYSLKRHTPRFKLWVLCVDEPSYNLLKKMNLANVTLVSLENIRNNILAKVQQKRQTHEFCWTLKAALLTYLLKNNYHLDSLLYMDADLFFFKDVRIIYNEWKDQSIFLTKLWLGHKSEQKSGKYSAGLIGFKRDKIGTQCLGSWRQKCLKWCYDRRENGRWGDQKYLDAWPQFYSAVKISQNKGINAGPWNIRKSYMPHSKDDLIYYHNMELVCYHFSGFGIINEDEFELCNRKKLPANAKNIYAVYEDEIRKIISKIKSRDKNFLQSITKKQPSAFFNHYDKRSEPHDET